MASQEQRKEQRTLIIGACERALRKNNEAHLNERNHAIAKHRPENEEEIKKLREEINEQETEINNLYKTVNKLKERKYNLENKGLPDEEAKAIAAKYKEKEKDILNLKESVIVDLAFSGSDARKVFDSLIEKLNKITG